MKLWSRKSPDLETRDTPVSDPDGVLHSLWSGMSAGSVAISGAAALRVPAVAAAVRVISEAAATLDVRIMEKAADGTETEDFKHPVGELLRGDANNWTSGFELIRDVTADALTRDWGGIALVTRVGGEAREIVRYAQSAVSVTCDPFTTEPSYRLNGQLIDARNVIHVRGPFDRSPLTLAAEAIGVAREMEKHAGALFKNGARPGGVIELPEKSGDSQIKKMIAGWRAAHDGADRTGKTAILWDGAKFTPMMLNSVDSQFLELRTFQVIEIARAFRIPPHLLFEMGRATYSNTETMGMTFLIYCLEPWLRALETALGRALFSREERRRYRILLDRDDLTRASLTERATAISSLVSSRVLNPNEARAWLDLAPYAGGDEFANPNTGSSQPAGDAPKGEPISEKQEVGDGPQ